MNFKWIFTICACVGSLTSGLQAFECGDWLVRARALWISPNDSSGSVNTIPDSKVSVEDSWTGELDFTYMWTQNIGTELVLATSKHKIEGEKSLHGVKIGSTWVLPPSLMLQYHFMPECSFQPYVGVGVNYTVFYSKHCSIEHTKLHLKNSWGASFQAGFDWLISDCWFVNLDAKYITMSTRATLSGGTPGHVHVRLNPWTLGIGVGRRF